MKARTCDRLCLIGVFLFALALRLGLALSLPADDSVFWDEPYWQYARNLAQGKGFWMSNPYGPELGIERAYAFRPPLFPFLWGLAYNVTSGAYAPIRCAHACLGAITCLLVVLLGRELTGRRTIGILAGGLCAIYPPLVWHSVHLMTEPLFIFLGTLAVFALIRYRRTTEWRWLATAAVAAGFGTLSRSMLAGFLPIMALWVWWARGRNARALLPAALFTAIVTLVMSPWIIRNAVVFDRFLPTTTDAGHGAYVANNPRSLDDPRGFYVPEDWSFLLQEGEERVGEVEASRRLVRRATQYLAEHPRIAARLMWERFLTFWRFYPHPEFIGKRQVLIYAASYIPVFILMIPGAVLIHRRAGRRRTDLLLVDALILYTVAIHTAILAMMRYRVPLMPFLMIFAATTLFSLWRAFRSRSAAPPAE